MKNIYKALSFYYLTRPISISIIIFNCLLFIECRNRTSPVRTESNLTTKNLNHLTKDPKDTLKVTDITKFPKSQFLPTLESSLNTKENGIYAASLLYAWKELETRLQIDLVETKILKDLQKSVFSTKLLEKGEIMTNVTLTNDIIKIHVEFNKNLPFETPFLRSNNPFVFQKRKVSSFYHNGRKDNTEIVFYNDDNDFAIRLLPIDTKHEIILYKSNFSNLKNIRQSIENLNIKQSTFLKNKKQKNKWKYAFKADDYLQIPIIHFNLEKIFKEIIGSKIKANSKTYPVEEAYQRIAFCLNEYGSTIESEADLTACTEVEDDTECVKPKKLIFDKPFIIFLKRKDCKQPYFTIYISNSELMESFRIINK
jgi:hypothetical protein